MINQMEKDLTFKFQIHSIIMCLDYKLEHQDWLNYQFFKTYVSAAYQKF